MTTRLRRLGLGAESAQGLIELLIALTVLAVGIGATLTLFADSLISQRHGAEEGTAITLADRQMETYQSMPY
jgi:Tfp pilus assembly protein PilV